MTPDKRAAAEAVLARIKPPSEHCDAETYRVYVEEFIADPAVTLHDLGLVMEYYQCHVADVVNRIVADRMKGAVEVTQ